MGQSSSQNIKKKKADDFFLSSKQYVEDELAKRNMIQREAEMALNIAKTRDNLHIFGSFYALLVTGIVSYRIIGKEKITPITGIPLIVGGILLGNMADFAYGNKLARINKEAEYILRYERARFVPFSQSSFAKFYTSEEKACFFDRSTAVGNLFPSSLFARELMGKRKSDINESRSGTQHT